MNRMDQKKLEYLHKAYLENGLDPVETEEWDELIKSEIASQPVKVLMEQTWHSILPEERIVLSKEESNRLYDKIISRPVSKQIRLWPKLAIVAAALVAIFGIALFTYDRLEAIRSTMSSSTDLPPGRQGATLTLANGKKVNLSEVRTGKIAEELGVTITKSPDGQLIYEIETLSKVAVHSNTLSTSNGETYGLRLPDGSLIWLNAGSSLHYPSSFASLKERRVRLQGEAYFEVAKDKTRPFIVQTATQEVEVLGTHFNVNSYQDEPVEKTTLIEGSVKVKSGNRIQKILPGEQVVNSGTELRVVKVNTAHVTDWKSGEFNLDEVDFRVAMRKIARWYDIELFYDSSVPQDIKAWGWISKNSKLSSVLTLIENSGQVQFRLEGRKLYIYK